MGETKAAKAVGLDPKKAAKAAETLVFLMNKSGADTVHSTAKKKDGTPGYLLLVSTDPDLIRRVESIVEEG